jgi:enoyl-CoA hydratase/carnithine racemase
LIGETRAKELIFTAIKIDAMTAERYRIATAVVAREALMTTCLEFAGQMLQNGPIALRQAKKRAIDQGRDVSLEKGLQLESEAYEVVIPTTDRQEALQAFDENRPPRVEGR